MGALAPAQRYIVKGAVDEELHELVGQLVDYFGSFKLVTGPYDKFQIF